MNVEEHRPRSVRVIGGKNFSAGELPHQVRIDRTETEPALLGAFPRPLYVIEDPFYFCSGKIRIDDEPRLLVYHTR